MNCRPGDLAIVVRSAAGNEGKLVTCIRISRSRHVTMTGQDLGPVWDIDKSLRGPDGVWGCEIADCQLRPIRDPGDDAVDETLRELETA